MLNHNSLIINKWNIINNDTDLQTPVKHLKESSLIYPII